MTALPVIDVSPLLGGGDASRCVEAIARSCRELGFFYISGHGIDLGLQARLESLSRAFFDQPLELKQRIAMAGGGRAWRGYFPPGAELTGGEPDLKEGIYFGAELGPEDPRVRAGTPLHGPNLFPELPGFRETVLAYIEALTSLGQAVMRGIALGLALPADFFASGLTAEPLVLFRIFNYPPDAGADLWGVGEHTDYGVLTLLKQDDVGGLEVRTPAGWIDAPPIANTFVCNLGDMLERMTGGAYRSTPHRVRSSASRARLSFPFFFDPGWSARVQPVAVPDAARIATDRAERWDKSSVFEFGGTYGEYLLAKVAKVFPTLGSAVLPR